MTEVSNYKKQNIIGDRIDLLIKQLGAENCAEQKMANHGLVRFGRPAVKYLCEALTHDRAVVRSGAAKALGAIADSSAAQPLLEILNDSDNLVRKEVAFALGELKASIAVSALCDSLEDQNLEVRKESVWALYKIGDRRAVTRLLSCLQETDKYLKLRAITVLGAFQSVESVPFLIELLSDEEEVQKEVIRSLGKIGCPDALPALTGLANENNKELADVLNEAVSMIDRST